MDFLRQDTVATIATQATHVTRISTNHLSMHSGTSSASLDDGAASAFMFEAARDHHQHTSTLRAAIRGGCRALGLLLVAGKGEDERLHVLFQHNRTPLDEVLQIIEDTAFKKDPAFPLLLVVSLALLTPRSAAEVPQILFDGLGDRLWRNTEPELPSPQDARGHVIVVLAPMTRSGDVFSDLSLRQQPPAALTKFPKNQMKSKHFDKSTRESTVVVNEPDMMEEWQSHAKTFAIWPGCTFDASLPHRSPHEIAVGFLPADELQTLEESKIQNLIEYHRQYLTQSYPVASRFTPANSNPAIAWSMGIQMSAMMFRGAGSSAQLAHAGRFAQDNGGCGYVLKPRHLRVAAHPDDDEAEIGHHKPDENEDLMMTLKIRVLAARAAVPYCRGGHVSLAVSVWGSSSDCRRETYRPVQTQCPWSPGAYGGHVVEWAEGKNEMTFVVRSPSTAILVFELSELEMQQGRPGHCEFRCPYEPGALRNSLGATVGTRQHGVRPDWVWLSLRPLGAHCADSRKAQPIKRARTVTE